MHYENKSSTVVDKLINHKSLCFSFRLHRTVTDYSTCYPSPTFYHWSSIC